MVDIATRVWNWLARSSARLIVLVLIVAGPAWADQVCVHPIPFAEQPDLRHDRLNSFSRAVSVPGFEQVFLDFGGGVPVHTILNGKVVPFIEAPLDKDNRAFPDILPFDNGDVVAFERVTKSLYRLNPENRRFEEVDLSMVGEIKGHTAYADPRSRGLPTLYLNGGEGGQDLWSVTEAGVGKVDYHSNWQTNGFPPLRIKDIGEFLDVQGKVMFRRGPDLAWQQIASTRWSGAPMGQFPFQSVRSHIANDGTFYLILADRVMVGRFDRDMIAPEIDYQVAGDAFIHEPTGQVLLYADEPFAGGSSQDRPTLTQVQAYLQLLTPNGPKAASGTELLPDMFASHVAVDAMFHAPSGQTILTYSDGLAAFDGSKLTAVPGYSHVAEHGMGLQTVGEAYVLRIIGEGNYRLVKDLTIANIPLPEATKDVELTFSDALGKYISVSWLPNMPTYVSGDLNAFEEIADAGIGLRAYIGDDPTIGQALFISDDTVYRTGSCSP